MSGIQVILLGLMLLIALYAISTFRKRKPGLLLIVIVFLMGCGLVFYPELSMIVSRKLGVGRGADLVFYSCILLFCFILLIAYIRIRRLEHEINSLMRNQSLKSGKNLR